MSVAQYLEPGKHLFDLLVIDEASQMRPEDALGAMLRCSQAVIVGDPEQLPPSDFFVASDGEGEQDAEDAPEESILELGRRCWHPMRMLDVHYRSRHQSLIAYSNREFYEERLLVYPSPVLEDPEFGVSCQRVDGAYEAGQGRNPSEAMAVVAEAAKLMRERIDRSIGIVAVNQPQRDLKDEQRTFSPEQRRLIWNTEEEQSQYRIDIGIVHPDKPGNYILGVECDGATYHSSKSARDRDRLREDVLIGLNWKIHRVWSTDWYRDSEREFGRLVQQIERFRGIA